MTVSSSMNSHEEVDKDESENPESGLNLEHDEQMGSNSKSLEQDTMSVQELQIHREDIHRTELYLARKGLTAIHPSIQQLVHLETLYINHNHLTQLDQLVPLCHRKLPLTKRTSRRGCFGIKHLFVQKNKLVTLNGSSLRHLKFLEVLDLSENELHNLEECLEELKHLHFLKELHLHGNPLSASVNYRQKIISIFPSLEILDRLAVTSIERDEAKNYCRLDETATLKSKPQRKIAFGKLVPLENGSSRYQKNAPKLSPSVLEIEAEVVRIRKKRETERKQREKDEEEMQRLESQKVGWQVHVFDIFQVIHSNPLSVIRKGVQHYTLKREKSVQTKPEIAPRCMENINMWESKEELDAWMNEVRVENEDSLIDCETAREWVHQCFINNPTWAPRVIDNITFREFMDILCAAKCTLCDRISSEAERRLYNVGEEETSWPLDLQPGHGDESNSIDQKEQMLRLCIQYATKAEKWRSLLDRKSHDERNDIATSTQARIWIKVHHEMGEVNEQCKRYLRNDAHRSVLLQIIQLVRVLLTHEEQTVAPSDLPSRFENDDLEFALSLLGECKILTREPSYTTSFRLAVPLKSLDSRVNKLVEHLQKSIHFFDISTSTNRLARAMADVI